MIKLCLVQRSSGEVMAVNFFDGCTRFLTSMVCSVLTRGREDEDGGEVFFLFVPFDVVRMFLVPERG